MALPTTVNGVLNTSTGNLKRWADGIDLSAQDDFDGDTETYRTDIPYPGKNFDDPRSDDYHHWDGSIWEVLDNVASTTTTFTLEEFVNFNNWDVTAFVDLAIYDDAANANKFSPNCAKVPATKTGTAVVKTASLDQGDMICELQLYSRDADVGNMDFFILIRSDQAGDNAYGVGITQESGVPILALCVIEAGVLSILDSSPSLVGLGIAADEVSILRVKAKGTKIEGVLMDSSRNKIVSVRREDPNITPDGSIGIHVETASTSDMFFDLVEVFNVA